MKMESVLRSLSVTVLFSVCLISFGCSSGLSGSGEASTTFSRNFYGQTICYQVETAKARGDMKKLERLLEEHNNLEELPDNVSVKLYRDADLNRNHVISDAEAEQFYNSFVSDFEDDLGRIRFKVEPTTERP